jgi:23S rRNA pseudouridine955/2504/2580 synthase
MRGTGSRQPGGGRQIAGRRDHDRRGRAGRNRDAQWPSEQRAAKHRGAVPGTAGVPPASSSDTDRRRAGETPTVPGTREPAAPPPLPPEATKVQTVAVTADESGMRVDRFLEARFPSLSFSHIQRVIRKGELRVDGKRVDGKDRLE